MLVCQVRDGCTHRIGCHLWHCWHDWPPHAQQRRTDSLHERFRPVLRSESIVDHHPHQQQQQHLHRRSHTQHPHRHNYPATARPYHSGCWRQAHRQLGTVGLGIVPPHGLQPDWRLHHHHHHHSPHSGRFGPTPTPARDRAAVVPPPRPFPPWLGWWVSHSLRCFGQPGRWCRQQPHRAGGGCVGRRTPGFPQRAGRGAGCGAGAALGEALRGASFGCRRQPQQRGGGGGGAGAGC